MTELQERQFKVIGSKNKLKFPSQPHMPERIVRFPMHKLQADRLVQDKQREGQGVQAEVG
jgi:hypothetical protein